MVNIIMDCRVHGVADENIILNTLNHPSTQNFLMHIMKEMLSKESIAPNHAELPVVGKVGGYPNNCPYTR